MSRSTAVRRVITLGTPLNGAFWYGTPEGHSRVRDMPVPVTAIYSRSDGIFDWRRCVQWPTASVDNAVIPSSHLGMASHPMALHIIADRLSRPAEPTGWPDRPTSRCIDGGSEDRHTSRRVPTASTVAMPTRKRVP